MSQKIRIKMCISDRYNPVKDAAPYKAPCVQVNSGYNPFETSSYKKPEFDWSKLYNDFEGCLLYTS